MFVDSIHHLFLSQCFKLQLLLRLLSRFMFHSKSKQLSLFIGLVREIHWSDVLVVQVYDREIGQHPSISELMPCEIHLSPLLLVVDVVLPVALLPDLGLEGDGE